MSDDKRPDWKKGFDQVKLFFKDTKFTGLSSEFQSKAENGKDLIIKNSKSTLNEIRRMMPRMMVQHQATVIGFKSFLRHRFYIYPTLKSRLLVLSGLTAWMVLRTAHMRYSTIHRMVGFYFMGNILAPDFDIHRRRFEIEMYEHYKWIMKFFN